MLFRASEGRRVDMVTLADTAPAQLGQATRLASLTEPELPAPAGLFDLIVQTFELHEPVTDGGRCRACTALWLCESARLAWRPSEGF